MDNGTSVNIPELEYKMNSRKISDLFSNDDINIIQETLKKNCQGTKCIPRKVIFEAVCKNLSNEINENVFCLLLSQLIEEEKITGFEIRRGRTGGVHRIGAFDNHDAEQKRLIREREEKKNNENCTVLLNGEAFLMKGSPYPVLKFITNILDGEPDPKNGNVKIGDMLFSVGNIDILQKYIIHQCDGRLNQ